MQQAYEEREKAYEQKENTLANLASLGILAAVFGHETLTHTNLVVNNVELLLNLLADNDDCLERVARQEIEECVSRAHGAAERIQTFAKFTIGNVRVAPQ